MADTSTDHSTSSAGIDLSQFYQVFFEEAGENLENMEQLLLELDIEAADDEELNAIFRCAHSIKGGAATFGFSDVAELTHQMETLLDKLRRHELTPTAPMVDVLLQSGDALKAMLGRHQGSGADAIDTSELLVNIGAMVPGQAPVAVTAAPKPAPAQPAAVAAPAVSAATDAAPTEGQRTVELRVGPLDNPSQADDLLDLFTFHVAREQVAFLAIGGSAKPAGNPAYGFFDASDAGQAATPEKGYGFFDDAPGSPDQPAAAAAAAAAAAEALALKPAAAKPATKAEKPAAAPEASTIRVSVEKVDQLINLVGELVITQAMLAQNSRGLDPVVYQQLVSGLTDLDRNTRDLANKLGKKVELVTQGEATELDKGLVEKITDPLTHLVRNSGDHGVEMPADRLAKGKPEVGTITLAASHQGGSIVIEVRDDGRGLNRDKLIK